MKTKILAIAIVAFLLLASVSTYGLKITEREVIQKKNVNGKKDIFADITFGRIKNIFYKAIEKIDTPSLKLSLEKKVKNTFDRLYRYGITDDTTLEDCLSDGSLLKLLLKILHLNIFCWFEINDIAAFVFPTRSLLNTSYPGRVIIGGMGKIYSNFIPNFLIEEYLNEYPLLKWIYISIIKRIGIVEQYDFHPFTLQWVVDFTLNSDLGGIESGWPDSTKYFKLNYHLSGIAFLVFAI
ncbi:MAG TPA: hypothetical protein ENG24_01070 [Thermoplasmatales archaeon]|nr:hypothetical protein [Thermoplasmatales archaeon]